MAKLFSDINLLKSFNLKTVMPDYLFKVRFTGQNIIRLQDYHVLDVTVPTYKFVIETTGLRGTTGITVFNANGLEVFHRSEQLEADGSTIELDLGSAGSGIYFLQLLGDNYRKTARIVVH